MTDKWVEEMEATMRNALDQARIDEGIVIMDDKQRPPTLEETVTFRTLEKQMKQVDTVIQLENARAAIVGEEEVLYSDRSGFIRAAIARELRRYAAEEIPNTRRRK